MQRVGTEIVLIETMEDSRMFCRYWKAKFLKKVLTKTPMTEASILTDKL